MPTVAIKLNQILIPLVDYQQHEADNKPEGRTAPRGSVENAATRRTYQLHIRLAEPTRLAIGRLGTFDFPAGDYVYTGSARRGLEARIARHLRREKTLRWHIDYLLAAPGASVTRVERASRAECEWQQSTPGWVLVAGFGSSDCRRGCGGHLKYMGPCAPGADDLAPAPPGHLANSGSECHDAEDVAERGRREHD